MGIVDETLFCLKMQENKVQWPDVKLWMDESEEETYSASPAIVGLVQDVVLFLWFI